MALHEGMNADDMTPNPSAPEEEHLPLSIKNILVDMMGVSPTNPNLIPTCKAAAAAMINEIKNHAKITITIDAGPPPTATATIE